MTKLNINGQQFEVSASPDTPLLWVIRDEVGLTGTKFGCGAALCGACTVLVGGTAIRSCVTPLSAAQGDEITTIEGLSQDGTHPLQVASTLHSAVIARRARS
jgi:isoquinoline 1-oxidoreductase subunit alpha